MDEILPIGYYMYNLSIIEEYMKEWIDIDEYSLLFESESDPVVKAKSKNDEVSSKSSNIVVKLIQNAIKMINSLIESITNFFAELGLKGDEKEAFNNFREQIKNDPKLKNVKVTVKDFRKINQEYDAILKKSEQELRKAKADETYDLSGIIRELNNVIDKKVEPASLIVTSEVALKMAESDQNTARALKVTLEHDKSFLEALEKEFGHGEAKRFKKRIDNAAKMTTLTKLMITLRGTRCKNIESCLKTTTTELRRGGFINPFSRIGRMMWKNKETREINKTITKNTPSYVAGTVKGKVMAAVDSHGEQSGKRYKNRTERMIDREKRNMKNTKKFWSNESMSITSDIRDEILSVSEEFDD